MGIVKVNGLHVACVIVSLKSTAYGVLDAIYAFWRLFPNTGFSKCEYRVRSSFLHFIYCYSIFHASSGRRPQKLLPGRYLQVRIIRDNINALEAPYWGALNAVGAYAVAINACP